MRAASAGKDGHAEQTRPFSAPAPTLVRDCTREPAVAKQLMRMRAKSRAQMSPGGKKSLRAFEAPHSRPGIPRQETRPSVHVTDRVRCGLGPRSVHQVRGQAACEAHWRVPIRVARGATRFLTVSPFIFTVFDMVPTRQVTGAKARGSAAARWASPRTLTWPVPADRATLRVRFSLPYQGRPPDSACDTGRGPDSGSVRPVRP